MDNNYYMKIHHIGIIVNDIIKNIEIYSKLGYTQKGNVITDNIQHNRIVFMSSPFSPMLELIEPINISSSIYNFKIGYHHICYEMENNEKILTTFNKLRIGKIFTKPTQAPAIDNRDIVFACLTNGVFVEFIL